MAREYKILIDGEWRVTAKKLEVVNPYNKEVIGVTFMAAPEEIEEAVSGAARVFKELSTMPSYRKSEIITRVADGLEARAEEVARIITLESGKPIRDARAEVLRGINTFRLASEECKRFAGEMIRMDASPGSDNRKGMVTRFPVGPILGISPFNFPLNLVAHKVAPAMATGCPLILKPASSTPLTSIILGEIVTGAGWPAGGLSIVPSSARDIEPLMDDDRIKKLTFTGSPAVGWMLKSKAGQKKVTLELGGNAGLIVHSGTDIDHASSRATVGAFSFAGQICISVQRIYVQEELFSEFAEKFIEKTEALKLGDPIEEETDIGPMIDDGEAERTGEWIKEAVEGGAELLTGGNTVGPFYMPTVLTKTTPSMKVCGSEVFAPVVTLEPYKTFDEAIELVNTSLYGLQAGVFTSDLKLAFRAYEALDVAGVIINDIPTYRVDNMPYGGVKMSGFGREGIRYAMEEMTEPKLLVLNLA